MIEQKSVSLFFKHSVALTKNMYLYSQTFKLILSYFAKLLWFDK